MGRGRGEAEAEMVDGKLQEGFDMEEEVPDYLLPVSFKARCHCVVWLTSNQPSPPYNCSSDRIFFFFGGLGFNLRTEMIKVQCLSSRSDNIEEKCFQRKA